MSGKAMSKKQQAATSNQLIGNKLFSKAWLIDQKSLIALILLITVVYFLCVN